MYTNILAHPTAVSAFTVAGAHAQAGTRCKLYKQDGVWYVAI